MVELNSGLQNITKYKCTSFIIKTLWLPNCNNYDMELA
jgi:hypothetical protein